MSSTKTPRSNRTEDGPTAGDVADAIGVDVDRLEAFVAKLEEPTAAAVLGWATVAPGAIDTVEAWLESRDSEEGNL